MRHPRTAPLRSRDPRAALSPSRTPGRGGCRRIGGTGAASRRAGVRAARGGSGTRRWERRSPAAGRAGPGPSLSPFSSSRRAPGTRRRRRDGTGTQLGAHRAEHREADREGRGTGRRHRTHAPGCSPGRTPPAPLPSRSPRGAVGSAQPDALRSDRTEPRTACFSSLRFDSFRCSQPRCGSSR